LAASVSVNLSLATLSDPTLADRITEAVRREGLETKAMILEITETAAMTDVGRCLENLARLRVKGFGLSIDDYGTGYSSMQQLARIPFTELKLDQSFVTNCAANLQHQAIIESSLDMARPAPPQDGGRGCRDAGRLDVPARPGVRGRPGLLHRQALAPRRSLALGGGVAGTRGMRPAA
jgi:hypothetical protein